MAKRSIVRLTDAERRTCDEVVSLLNGSSQMMRRARVLLKADADGPAWIDEKICAAFGCRVQTVEGIRQTLKKRHDQAEDRVLGHPSGGGRRVRGLHRGSAENLCQILRSAVWTSPRFVGMSTLYIRWVARDTRLNRFGLEGSRSCKFDRTARRFQWA